MFKGHIKCDNSYDGSYFQNLLIYLQYNEADNWDMRYILRDQIILWFHECVGSNIKDNLMSTLKRICQGRTSR